MSDQRKLRADAKQGFHQFAMHLYQSYLQTHTEKEAKQLVGESIKEQLGLFMDSATGYGDVNEVIESKIREFAKERMANPDDYDIQMYYSEKIQALKKAQEILNK